MCETLACPAAQPRVLPKCPIVPVPRRHTFATEAIRAGVDVETVSKTLGHFSVGFTLDVYGHVTQEMKEEAARRIQTAIDRRMG